jgi:hypothetical protein
MASSEEFLAAQRARKAQEDILLEYAGIYAKLAHELQHDPERIYFGLDAKERSAPKRGNAPLPRPPDLDGLIATLEAFRERLNIERQLYGTLAPEIQRQLEPLEPPGASVTIITKGK